MSLSSPRSYLIAYELAEPEHTRPQIAEAIMAIGEAWARPLETVWVLRTRLAAEEIEARLAPLLAENDGLMVQETRGEAALANTGMRWFRPRRSAALDALESAAVLAFPPRANDGGGGLERAA